MSHRTIRKMATGLALASALALAVMIHARRVAATSCAPQWTIDLQLVSVTADGVPNTEPYDVRRVQLKQSAPSALQLWALTNDQASYYSETYRAAAAPGP